MACFSQFPHSPNAAQTVRLHRVRRARLHQSGLLTRQGQPARRARALEGLFRQGWYRRGPGARSRQPGYAARCGS